MGIRRRVAVGGGEDDEDDGALRQLAAGDRRAAGEDAAGVLDRRVVAEDLADDAGKTAMGHQLPQLRVSGEGEERVADEAGRGLVGLEEEADRVGDDGLRVVPPEPPGLAAERGEKAAARVATVRYEAAEALEEASSRD